MRQRYHIDTVFNTLRFSYNTINYILNSPYGVDIECLWSDLNQNYSPT